VANDAATDRVLGRRPADYGRRVVHRIGVRSLLALVVLGAGTPMLGLLVGFHTVTFVVAELSAMAAMLLLDRRVMPILDRRIRGIRG
jgi:hypothetical protein